jgi:hypothetical protein
MGAGEGGMVAVDGAGVMGRWAPASGSGASGSDAFVCARTGVVVVSNPRSKNRGSLVIILP